MLKIIKRIFVKGKILWVSTFLILSFVSKAQNESLKFYIQAGINQNTGSLGFDSALASASQLISDINAFNGWQVGFTIREYHSETQYLAFETLYSSNETKLVIGPPDSLSLPTTQTLNSQKIMLSISPGFRIFRLIRGQAGLNGIFELNNGFQESFDSFKLAYRLGVGLDIFKLTADISYNASFNKSFGVLDGIPLSNSHSQFLFTIGYKF